MDEIKIVDSVLSPIDSTFVMIDVGGHHGSSCLRFANQGASVFVFEPDDANRAPLAKNVQSLANVVIDTRAVSDKDGETVAWFQSDESTGISGMHAFRDTHEAVAEVKTITLKTFCANKKIPKIDFLKIDTEGFDLHVLRGHNWVDSSLRPRAIVCEFEDAKTTSLGYAWSDMARFLQDQGYYTVVSEWFPIVRYGIQHKWRKFTQFPCSLEDENAWGNLVAFREEADFQQALIYCERLKIEYEYPKPAEARAELSRKTTDTHKSLAQRIIGKLKRLIRS